MERVASPAVRRKRPCVDDELQRNVTRLIGTLPRKLRDALLLAGHRRTHLRTDRPMLGAPSARSSGASRKPGAC